MEFGGIDAHLLRFSMAAPVNYNYDFSGLAEALIFYQSSNYAVFLAAIAAPIYPSDQHYFIF